jgi:uncharacterized protein
MKIALVGASGNAGSRILKEFTSRGHTVVAIARNPDKIEAQLGVCVATANANDVQALASAVKDVDVVVSALHFADSDPEKLIAAVRQAAVGRYLVVGGAAGLILPGTNQRLVDSGQIPPGQGRTVDDQKRDEFDFLRGLCDCAGGRDRNYATPPPALHRRLLMRPPKPALRQRLNWLPTLRLGRMRQLST